MSIFPKARETRAAMRAAKGNNQDRRLDSHNSEWN